MPVTFQIVFYSLYLSKIIYDEYLSVVIIAENVHSRAHTIVGITLIQKKKNSQGNETTKSATVNLVDLAGRFVRFLYLSCH